jgi:signal transduction histidine kinase/methyl-accepting chemotaxis protein
MATVTTAVLILLVLFLALYRSNKAIEASEIADDIITGALERVALRNDYHQNNSERARVQWVAMHERIGGLLKTASERFREPGDRDTLAALIKAQGSIGKHFAGIVGNREKLRLGTIPADLARETESRLISQLNMRVYETLLNGRSLQASAREALFAAVRLAGWGLFCLLAVVIAAAIRNFRTMERAITDRIDRLRAGTAVIGAGNLDYRINLTGDDEFTELGEAFDAMAARLHGSYRDLETEIEERRSVEKALRQAHDELDLRVLERTNELQQAKSSLRRSNETLELRVAERTAELQAANSLLFDSRRAALTMMEGAVAARTQAEEIAERLRREVSERRQAEAALRESMRRFELLAQTAGALLQAPAPEVLVESLCRKVMAYLDCQAFFNFLVDEEAGRLHLNAYAGVPPAAARRIEWLEYGAAICECAARDGSRIVAERVQSTPDVRAEFVRSVGIKAYCCNPLLGPGGKVIGTLSFGTVARETFSEEDLSLMQAVTDLVAVAMTRMQTTETLRRTADELARSNQELAQFAYVASHDLQEPLRMVSGFVSLLQARYADRFDDAGRDFIGRALEGASRMRQLIDDLLEYGRVERGEHPAAPFHAREAFDAALANLATVIAESGAEVTAGELPTLIGDRAQLVAVLQNLIANAITYRRAEAAPRVHVGARRRGEAWVFSVADNGIGIPSEQFERIFLIFQRLHNREKYPGTGLGLAIVKKIVEADGGRVWVESRVGEGSTFFFTAPAAPETRRHRDRHDPSAEPG